MPLELIVSPGGEADLYSIYELAAGNRPMAAARFVEEIRRTCLLFAEQPRLGRGVRSPRSRLRVFVMRRRVTILYRIEGQTIRVLRFFYRGGDVIRLVRGLR